MSVNTEFCDPFSGDVQDIWMKLEHCGRYLFAADFLRDHNCGSVYDLACANGYGSSMLLKSAERVYAADRNAGYLDSPYLKRKGICCFCFDFDANPLPAGLPCADAAVCFETIEHLCKPFEFIGRLPKLIADNGWLLLSFPNAAFERFNEDGSNRDPYHLHTLDLNEVKAALEQNGFGIDCVLGQPMCNEICSMQHELKEQGKLKREYVDRAFKYDRRSIETLARLLAYPSPERVENSYSFIIVARKRN